MTHNIPTGEFQIIKYEIEYPWTYMVKAIYENDTYWYHFTGCVEEVHFIGGQHRNKCCGS